MKKTLLIVLPIICLNIIAIFFLLPERKDSVYIAVVGPMSGGSIEIGDEMLRGIRLYISKVNKRGGINGRKVELILFDDKNDRRNALKVSSRITDDNRLMLVIGHYYSQTSMAAGEVYRGSGIPAITASATAESVTMENDWYFRTIPGNRLMARFIANYVKWSLVKSEISIIYDFDEYGMSLLDNIEKEAKNLDIKVKNKWGFNRESKNLNEQLSTISSKVRATDDPGIIFFATHSSAATKLVTSLKYPGTNYIFIGADALSGRKFIRVLNEYPAENRWPGYYSDGIYAVSPFLIETADERAVAFQKEFVSAYNKEPSWVSACYYDAAQIALEAIEKAGVQGNKVMEDRRRIKDALGRFNSYYSAFEGITGLLYFDKEGNARRPLAIGFYQKQKFIPAFSQYRLVADEAKEDQKIIQVEGQKMTGIRMVYAGIDINKISDMNVKQGIYNIDFLIWFRFEGVFDDTRIKFTNAVEPNLKLGSPIAEEVNGNVTTRTYRLIADFKSDFGFYEYPFDYHSLHIRFHHQNIPRIKLIYVPDTLGMPKFAREEDIGNAVSNEISGWKITNISCFQDNINLSKNEDKKILYSRINSEIKIERNEKGFIIGTFFPFIVILGMLFFIHSIPAEKMTVRIFVCVAAAATGSIYHLLLFSLSSGFIALEYVLYAIYFLSITTALVSIEAYNLRGRRIAKRIDQIDKAMYSFIILLSIVSLLAYLFYYYYY
ncbi:ABC transporter substrate-binding protein [Desulfococcaceae bacterium HSG8]|nr:ABC transporter substrate-binding protein [Desulfococcaceae bacterium HSG8]